MRQHAMLSASGAERWLICTPSARLEADQQYEYTDEAVEGGGSSIYADEGTLAHELCRVLTIQTAWGVNVDKEIADIKSDELYDESMMDYAQEWANFIVDKVRVAPEGTIMMLERRFNLREYIPEGFGTADVLLAGPGFIDVNDFKYGKGVYVDAYENPQMMIYALGAYQEMSLLYPINNIYMTIYQPRIGNISTYEITAENLLIWAREVLRPTALIAFQGLGDLVAGDHCRFCKVRGTCKAAATLNLQLAAKTFDPPSLTDEQIVKILQRADSMKKWITAVEQYALSESIKGKKWPGMKLVQGRSNRKYTDETKIIKSLTDNGYDALEIIKPGKLVGITELTKKIGKKQFDKLVAPYVIKPQGAPALVDEGDGRPTWDSNEAAKTVFTPIEDSDQEES